jgi:hypothetical protein
VTVSSGAKLAPGTNGVAGTLTINNSLTLASGSTTAVDVVSDDSTSDLVTGPTSVSYNGTLVVSNLGIAAITNGQTFQIFTASSPTGNFSSIIPAPGAGLAWNFTPASGVLSVVSGTASYSTNITASVSGNVLSLSWPATHLGWFLQTQTNGLSTGLATNWTDVAGSSATTSNNVTINPANPTVFFRLRNP